MLLRNIKAYAHRTPTALVEHLAVDLQDRLFKKVLLATFNDVKYRLKPEQFSAFLSSKKAPAETAEPAQPLDEHWEGWPVLDAMGSGDLSGDAAKHALAVAYNLLARDDREVIMMVLDKTWRNGVTQDKVNLAVPGTFRPAKFMLAHSARNDDGTLSKRVKFPVLGTYKYDGFRGILCIDTERCLSRNGNPYPLAPELLDSLLCLSQELGQVYDLGYCPAIDGELFAGSWKATAEARAIGYQNMVVFGHLPSSMIYGGTSEPFNVANFLDQVDLLVTSLGLENISTPIRRVLHNEPELEAFYQEALAAGYEGLVLTSLERPYEGKRSYHWLKCKPADPLDAPITGVILGAERSKNEGKVVGLQVTYNAVSSGVSGMSQELIDRCTQMHAEGHLVTEPPLIAEVVIHELTPDGALRHGRVKKIRFDK